MIRFTLAALGVIAIAPSAVIGQTLAEDAAKFGARQSVLSPSISPSGNQLLYIQPGVQAEETIFVVDLKGLAAPNPIILMNEAQARLNECSWANEERIVCSIFGYQEVGGTLLGFTRLISLKSDGTDMIRLTPQTNWRTMGTLQNGGRLMALDIDGEENKVLMTRQYIKESGAGTKLYNDKEGLGVDWVDVTNGRNRTVEQPNRKSSGYIADENGKIRIMEVTESSASGYDGSDVRYLYRPAGSSKWEALSTIDSRGSVDRGFVPVAVDSAKNVAFGFDSEGGYNALYSVALDGSGKREKLMARDDVDVDGLIRIGRKDRVVGASFATEKRHVKYFDPELDRLAAGLSKALPGKPLISIVDANQDESVILLIASSDTDPGMLYLYEKATQRLNELLPLRDPLVGRKMGKMTPISYPAADGTAIPGYLTIPAESTGKNLATIVLPHGGPGARDEWGFDWLPQFFIARGYAVFQPNYRGSAGYGEAWYGKNGFQEWGTAISDVNDAGRWLVSQGIANPDRLAIVGWSYGGYAALQSQVIDANLYKAVVAIAPVSDLELLREENRNYTSFLAYDKFIGTGPHVAAGSPARHADNFRSPVLLVHGTMDQNVSVAHSKLMRDRLKGAGKSAEYLEFDGLDHYLNHSQARGIMLKRIGGFLDTSLGR